MTEPDDVGTRLSLLEEAHRSHRAELGQVRRELNELKRQMNDDGDTFRPTLKKRVERLESSGLAWETAEAREALVGLRKLRDTLDDMFPREDE